MIDGARRTVCTDPQCGYVFWNNPVPVVAALVRYQGQILLARNAHWPAGMFSLVAGYLEQNEAPEAAVVREVKEELSLDASIQAFIGHYSFTLKNQLIIAYALHATGNLVLNHEIAEVKMVPPDRLDPAMFGKLALTAAVVRDWLRLEVSC